MNEPKIHRLILATKIHKGTQRKRQYLNHPNEKLLEVQKPSKKQQAISGFLRFVEQTVSWLYEGARAILEMLFSKRFLAAGGKSWLWI
jgi:hypothetical protein